MKSFRTMICLLLAVSTYGFACSCLPPPPDVHTPREVAQWHVKTSDVVFEGTVEKTSWQGWPMKPEPGRKIFMRPAITVSFSDVHVYRGQSQEQLTVETSIEDSDCSYRFQLGKSYLVYAGIGSDKKLYTDVCNGTSRIKDAGAALRLLRGEPPALSDLTDKKDSSSPEPTGHQVCGKILFPKGVRPMPMKVYLWTAEDEDALSSTAVEAGKDGTFCEKGLDEGKYFVAAIEAAALEDEPKHPGFRYASYYPGVLDRSQAQPIVVGEQDTTVRADFSVLREPLHTVRGYLRGVPEGDHDTLMILLIAPHTNALNFLKPVELGPHGIFEFHRVPAGAYSAFALDAASGDEITAICVSEIVDLRVSYPVEDLKLQFVPPQP